MNIIVWILLNIIVGIFIEYYWDMLAFDNMEFWSGVSSGTVSSSPLMYFGKCQYLTVAVMMFPN